MIKLTTKKIFLLKKYIMRLLIWLSGGLLLIWLGSFFDPFFKNINPFVFESFGSILNIIFVYIVYLLKFQISVGSLILFGILLLILYLLIIKIKLNKRDLIIREAKYGSGSSLADITYKLNELVIDNRLTVRLSNGLAGFDPAPGIVKTATIKFTYGKNVYEKKYKEGDTINLPHV